MEIAIGIDVHKEKCAAFAKFAGKGEPRPRHEEFLEKPFYMRSRTKAAAQSAARPAFGVDILKGSAMMGSASLAYGVGDRVHHIKFGDGTVKEIADGKRDKQVTVEFDQYGTKKMLAGFAKLQKI